MVNEKDMAFLEQMTRDVIEASRVRHGQKAEPFKPNSSGGTLIRPGGRECYPAYWIRDFVLSIDCGLIPPDEVRHALMVTARTQQCGDRSLPTGSWIPDGAVADHVHFSGEPIYFPGTYDAPDQGGPWGRQPPFGDHFLFTHLAWYAIVEQDQHDLLTVTIDGTALLDRLVKAFHVAPADRDTHLVECTLENRGVNFGFYDMVIHTGRLLFASCLKYRAARQLADLFRRANDDASAGRYDDIAETIQRALPGAFAWKDGLPQASTGLSAQPDVWGAALGVYVGAFTGEPGKAICETLLKGYRAGTIACRGNIRHIPTTADFSQTSAWEKTVTRGHKPRNLYQNGAYWGTPTGWVCQAIAQVDESSARQLAGEYIAELREGDFRKGEDYGSPWECFHIAENHYQNPVYLTSVTCPYAAFQLNALPACATRAC